MKFLKMQDKSLTFIQKKIDQIMGPLASIWKAVYRARRFGVHSSRHLETGRTVVLVGQANATCLYERSDNFMAKIMKGFKKAQEHLDL